MTEDFIYTLDLAAKLDSTADFICRQAWGEIDYPPPFGRDAYPEEAYIADLDSKSGASLKVLRTLRNQHYYFANILHKLALKKLFEDTKLLCFSLQS